MVGFRGLESCSIEGRPPSSLGRVPSALAPSASERGMPLAAAEEYGVKMIGRLGGFPVAKLLAIHEIKPGRRDEDKPPTPFGRPPSGTLGGGERAPIPPPVDQIARAA